VIFIGSTSTALPRASHGARHGPPTCRDLSPHARQVAPQLDNVLTQIDVHRVRAAKYVVPRWVGSVAKTTQFDSKRGGV